MVRPYNIRDLQLYFPDKMPPPAAGSFEIAIAAAGGTSTGAYIAGVLDFIVEALDSFAAAQAMNAANTPMHKVRVVNLTGTSAGGLSVGLASTYVMRQFPHVYHDAKWTQLVAAGLATGVQNTSIDPLYRAWVEEVDLSKLLAKPTDAETNISIFAPAPKDIADTVFAMMSGQPVRASWPSWAAKPLDLRLTSGNLRGVPYSLAFENQPVLQAGERMAMHRDHVAFAISPTGAPGAPDAHELSSEAFNAGPAWGLFRSAAVSSSAIPVIFAPVAVMGQDPIAYDWRNCYFDSTLNVAIVDQPFWTNRPTTYNFTASDGGLFDDAPFQLAHRIMSGAEGVNNRGGDSANRAVILIAPIIDETAGDPPDPILPPPDGAKPQPGQTSTPFSRLVSALTSVVFSPIEQSRLAAFDLALIKSESVFSRYMISPSREYPDPNYPGLMGPSKSLMSLPLHAAMGFASLAYRRHDFLLGRRNAQRFLSDQFMLPAGNPVIRTGDPWEPTDIKPGTDPKTGRPTTFYPIIPLRGAVHQNFEEPLPAWDWQALTPANIDTFVSDFGVRVDSIWQKVRTSLTAGSGFWAGVGNALFVGPILWGVWTFKLRPLLIDTFKAALIGAQAALNPADLKPP